MGTLCDGDVPGFNDLTHKDKYAFTKGASIAKKIRANCNRGVTTFRNSGTMLHVQPLSTMVRISWW